MPVYNSGEYLKTAVESVLSQSLREIELILVDDGSTDGSSERCDEYAKEDSRVVVIHQKNGGICNARNAALKIAKGEYIGFSDHDDEFAKETYEKAYSFATTNDLDLVKFGHKTIKSQGNTVLKVWNFCHTKQIYQPEEVGTHYLKMLQRRQMECVWDSLYRKDFLQRHSLELNPEFKAGGEDVDFNGRVVSCKPKIGIMSEVFYFHYIRVGFSTSTKFKEVNVLNALSFAGRLNQYLSTYNTDDIFKENSLLYADTIIQRSVGSLLYSTSMPACKYSKEKISILLDKIRNDKAIHPCCFAISKIQFIIKNPKYGFLYTAFCNKWYNICRILYYMHNLRDKVISNKVVQ